MYILLAICMILFNESTFAMEEDPFDLGYLAKNFGLKPDDVENIKNICDSQCTISFKTEASAKIFYKTMKKTGCKPMFLDFLKQVTLFGKDCVIKAAKSKDNAIVDDNILENKLIARSKSVSQKSESFGVDIEHVKNEIVTGEFFAGDPTAIDIQINEIIDNAGIALEIKRTAITKCCSEKKYLLELIKSLQSKELLANFIRRIALTRIYEEYDEGEGSRAICMTIYKVNSYGKTTIKSMFEACANLEK
jgi:hypothetical protein